MMSGHGHHLDAFPMRRSLVQECLALCRADHDQPPSQPPTSNLPAAGAQEEDSTRLVLERWQLRMRVLGLPMHGGSASMPAWAMHGRMEAPGAAASQGPGEEGQLPEESMAAAMGVVMPALLPSTSASVAREGLHALSELLAGGCGRHYPSCVDASHLHSVLQQSLAFAPGAADPSFLAAAMQLATALAALTCTPHGDTHMGRAVGSHMRHVGQADHAGTVSGDVGHVDHMGHADVNQGVQGASGSAAGLAADSHAHATKRRRAEPADGSDAAEHPHQHHPQPQPQPQPQPHQQHDTQHHYQHHQHHPHPHQQHETQHHHHHPQQQQQGLPGGVVPVSQGPPLSWPHADALHRGLVAWAGHWHPRVRRGALAALVAAHGGGQALPTPATAATASAPHGGGPVLTAPATATTSIPQPSLFNAPASTITASAPLPSPPQAPAVAAAGASVALPAAATASGVSQPLLYQCCAAHQVCAAYSAAVACLADDHPRVRSSAMRLVAALAGTHPRLQLPGPRWTQLGVPQALADDGVQRLAGCVADGEAGVRRDALRLMAGLPRCSLRVKLQLLSKKATIAVSAPAERDITPPQATGAGSSSNAQRGAGRGNARGAGGAPQQAGRQGRGGGAAGAGTGGGGGGGTGGGGGAGTGGGGGGGGGAGGGWAWCGGPGARGLELLDASVGALVHGTEDEDSQVRVSTAEALVTLSCQELMPLRHAAHTSNTAADAPHPGGVPASSSSAAPATATSTTTTGGVESVGSQRQVVAQCVEYLGDLLQDEAESVREAAVRGLERLVDLATTTTTGMATTIPTTTNQGQEHTTSSQPKGRSTGPISSTNATSTAGQGSPPGTPPGSGSAPGMPGSTRAASGAAPPSDGQQGGAGVAGGRAGAAGGGAGVAGGGAGGRLPPGATGGDRVNLPPVTVLSKDQVSELETALYDPSEAVRRVARQLLGNPGVTDPWETSMVKGLALAAARALGMLAGRDGEVEAVLGLVRGVAGQAPGQARIAAIDIAKQKQRQEGAAAGGGGGGGGGAGGGAGVAEEMQVGRGHLRVMHALLQGAGDVK